MSRISQAQLDSNLRVTRVEAALRDAVAAHSVQDPELTIEEILAALVRVMGTQTAILRSAQ